MYNILLSALAAVSAIAPVTAAAKASADASALPPNRDVGHAAEIARSMVAREELLHLNTLREDGIPVSFVEYYVASDLCPDVSVSNNGNPILLLLEMSSSYGNYVKNGKFSASVEAHPRPGGPHHGSRGPHDGPMAHPRATLFGELKELNASTELAHCFASRHPDAWPWIPTGSNETLVHDGRWFELDVEDVYFVGGFGDRAYIGGIDAELYHAAELRVPHDREPHDREPHDREPHDREPHDREPHDREPHDREPHDREPHDREPHDREPHDREPHDREPHDREPHDREPHDREPHDREPHDREPHDREPHDREPHHKEPPKHKQHKNKHPEDKEHDKLKESGKTKTHKKCGKKTKHKGKHDGKQRNEKDEKRKQHLDDTPQNNHNPADVGLGSQRLDQVPFWSNLKTFIFAAFNQY